MTAIRMKPRIGLLAGLLACSWAITLPARAAEPESCRALRMSDPGWTDITSTNGVAGVVLDALGYQQRVETLSVPITFRALQDGIIDVFLGNWMPAQQNSAGPLIQSGKVDLVRHNLERAKFTLAVPTYVAEAGVHGFADLSRFADRFGKKIYGIDAGAPANQNIQHMLDAGDFGLRGWELVDSSEQAMLGEVGQAVQRKQWVVFLAWEPHPMNTKLPITYLDGGDRYFGANYGDTTVNTLARKGYVAECPNAGRFFSQLAFSVGMENELMTDTESMRKDSKAAAVRYLRSHPDLLAPWLQGVTTRDGKDGLAAVKASLGQ